MRFRVKSPVGRRRGGGGEKNGKDGVGEGETQEEGERGGERSVASPESGGEDGGGGNIARAPVAGRSEEDGGCSGVGREGFGQGGGAEGIAGAGGAAPSGPDVAQVLRSRREILEGGKKALDVCSPLGDVVLSK